MGCKVLVNSDKVSAIKKEMFIEWVIESGCKSLFLIFLGCHSVIL